MGVVLDLQMLPHRRGGLWRAARIGPNRVIDVETTAALLAEPGDAARGLLGAPAPHAEAAKSPGIGHRRSQSGRARAAHRSLQNGPFEIQALGQGVCRPHARFLPSPSPQLMPASGARPKRRVWATPHSYSVRRSTISVRRSTIRPVPFTPCGRSRRPTAITEMGHSARNHG